MPTLISIGPPITNKPPFKNMKNLCFIGGSFFKEILLTFGSFNESKYATGHFKCIIKREVVMFLSFRRNKEPKYLKIQIPWKLKINK